MKHLKAIQKEVHKIMPHFQKRITNQAVSIAIRIIADEFQKSPYDVVGWLGRFTNTIDQFKEEERRYDTT